MHIEHLWNGSKESPRGFTLIELLVVIGIISLLMTILLPILARAKEAARRVKCLANLRGMAQAARLHAFDHRGHMPVAGGIFPTERGFFPGPEGLNDSARLKYSYYTHGDSLGYAPLPLPAALGQYMGIAGLTRHRLEPMHRLEINKEMKRPDLREHFACPSQDPDSIVAGYGIYWQHMFGARIYMSYIANGQFLGRFPVGTPQGPPTPAGQLSKVRRPAEVFLFADGGPTSGAGGLYTVQSGNTKHQTLYDYWSSPGLNWKQFDHTRHRSLMNLVFLDGHAETVVMPKLDSSGYAIDGQTGDFDRIGLQRGISQ